MQGIQRGHGKLLEQPGITVQPRRAGERPRRFALAEKKAGDYIEKRQDAPDSLISPERKGELFHVMATLISGVVEDPKMRQTLLEKLSRDKENPFVKLVREQGKAEGKAEGAVEAARRALLHALEFRFGRPSEDLVGRIGNISCLENLETLLPKALSAPSVEAFLESLE